MLNTALLINLLGFSVGIALYGLLLVMVVRHRRAGERAGFDFLLLVTATLGLIWNLGEFAVFILKDFGTVPVSPWLLALSYSALGFLPSVVVHSTWKSADDASYRLRLLTISAYALSSFAALLNLISVITSGEAPSRASLRILTVGALVMLVVLLVLAFRQALEKKAVWVAALLVFAVSALHLSSHNDQSSWVVELVAHQSSLPLALAILLQDYRFAFADLFLKRALSLMLLALLAFALYVWAAVPLLAWHETHDRNDVQAAVIVLGLWIATALAYPKLHDFAEWLVDSVILRRTDFEMLKLEISAAVEKEDDPKDMLDAVCRRLKAALGSESAEWRKIDDSDEILPAVRLEPRRTTVFIPTVEGPFFEIDLWNLAGGRNLLSDEIQMLEAVALLAARRIDSLRVTNERFELELREQEFSKLAAEAQLSALRARINPHFLFNALTTIGHLIQTAPEKAFDTLMGLTKLLRGVLRSTGEFSTLAEEVKLIENYLEIEKARFEERLSVRIDVPDKLGTFRIPSLVLQPLVENAIKHGISENKSGGEVSVSAKLETGEESRVLVLEVADTGSGRVPSGFERAQGVGLGSIRQRLEAHYGAAAEFKIRGDLSGTVATILLPIGTQTQATAK